MGTHARLAGYRKRPKPRAHSNPISDLLVLFLFGVHTWRCSGLTPGSALRNHPGSAQGTPWDAGNGTQVTLCEASARPTVISLQPAHFCSSKLFPEGPEGPDPQPESSSTRLPQAASRSFQKLPRAPFQFLSVLFFNFFGGKEKSLHRVSRRCLLCSHRSMASGLRTGPSPRLGQMSPEVGSLSFPPPIVV